MKLAAAQNGTNGGDGTGSNGAPTSVVADDLAEFRTRRRTSVTGASAGPSTDAILEALRRENEQLRTRVADMERDYVRLTRLNEIYREELIDHRRRVRSSISFLPIVGFSTITDGDVGGQPDWDFKCGARFSFTPSKVDSKRYVRISHCGNHARSNTTTGFRCTNSTTFITDTQADDGPGMGGTHYIVALPRIVC